MIIKDWKAPLRVWIGWMIRKVENKKSANSLVIVTKYVLTQLQTVLVSTTRCVFLKNAPAGKQVQDMEIG